MLFVVLHAMSDKPSLPKGTRDFDPSVMLRRNYILSAIKSVFEKFGFLPLETPAMEKLSVLTGKYGDEGDQLLYKILNSGDFLSGVSANDMQDGARKMAPKIAEKGLRYDLTVPFARFVATNQHLITLPFKRYQIQPVWRADRPQKGRYREFYQCDADVAGTTSLFCEVEIILMIREVFNKLNIKNYSIRCNHRAILKGLSEYLCIPDKETDLTVAIDKLEKIGARGVEKELIDKGISTDKIDTLMQLLKIDGGNDEKMETLKTSLQGTSGIKGIEEFREVLSMLNKMGQGEEHVMFDLSLARGLSYYTGIIFEVDIENSGTGSVSGGGRYDNLTAFFGGQQIPGTGISFGIDRIYDAMETLHLFPKNVYQSTRVLIVHFDQQCFEYGLKVLAFLRHNEISAEIYPDMSKIKKQLSYANKKEIPHVIVIGEKEMASGALTVKNMASGEEVTETIENIVNIIGN